MARHEFAHVNLNLLAALDTLLAERNVRRAAERMGVTQSAMSRTLAQLRNLFDDPILVRSGNHMLPTPRAEEIANPLRLAIRDLRAVLDGPAGFDPATTRRRFTIAASDATAVTVLPSLIARFAREAPRASLDIVPVQRDSIVRSMEQGDVDLFIGAGLPTAAGLIRHTLFDSHFAVLARADHPEIGEILDLDMYCRLPHAMVTITRRGAGLVDRVLETHGRSRMVALRIPYFLAAPPILASTDLLLTLPGGPARYFAERFALRVFDAPFELPGGPVELDWHERYHRDPALAWLRSLATSAHTTII